MTSPRWPVDDAMVDAALKELANIPLDGPAPPDPSFLWWKAQLLRRLDAERQAAEPIEIGDRVHVGAALLGAAALAGGAWNQVSSVAGLPTAIVIGLGALVALSAVATLAWHELRGG